MSIGMILNRAWGMEEGVDANIDGGVAALRIEIVDPQAPGDTITIKRQPVANGHDTDNHHADEGPVRLTFIADEEN